ncbi:MAG TPA: histidine kinase, partial [Marmoricola sp.]|nr:histidine kinase [Marmoricola sp.]
SSMAGISTAPGLTAQRLARVLEYALLTFFLAIPIPFYAHHNARPVVAVLHVGLVLPLFWRRRFPEFVFAVVATIAFVQWLVYEPFPTDVALLIALYTVASLRPLRWAILAGSVLEFGVLLVVIGHNTVLGRNPNGQSAHAKLLEFILLSGLTTAAAVLGVNGQTRRAYLSEVEERAARLEAERDQQSQLAVAGERARVAREMHDIVAHNLAVMVALTDGAALTLTTNPGRAEIALNEASNAGRIALTDMRRVLGILRDPDTEADVPRDSMPHLTALDQLVETVRHTGLDVRYRTTGPIQTLPEALQLSIYRIVQEALTNVMKHARGAQTVTIEIAVSEAEVVIVVHDDGAGTDAPPGVGHGLVGMRERAALHSGSVSAGPTPTGWRAEARLQIKLESEPS